MTDNYDESPVKYDVYYERVAKHVRWMVVAVAATTLFLSQALNLVIVSILTFVALYNITRQFPSLKKLSFFTSKSINLAIDTVFVVAVVGLSGALDSPMILLLVLPVIFSVFWYGIRGIVSILALLVVFLELVPVIGVEVAGFDLPGTSFIHIASIAIVAYAAERLTYVERGHRQRTTELYTQVEGERQKLLTLINGIAEIVIAVDRDDKISLYNAAALELLNTNDDIGSKNFNELLPLNDKDGNSVDILSEAKKAEGPGIYHNRDLIYKDAEAGNINIEVSVAPIKPSYTSLGTKTSESGFILVLRDITKVKTLEEQRDEFVSVISHELRTPVAVVEANLSTVLLPKMAPKDPKVKNMLQEAHEKIVFLGELIKDLTALSRVEQQAIKLNFERFDAVELAKSVISTFDAEARNKNIKLELNSEPKLPKVLSSPDFVQEVLQNLVSNAIKYTEEGTVTISVGKATKLSGGVAFNVSDSGIGISRQDQKKIYQKFFRVEDYKTKHVRGTGLGLYLVKKITDRLGAKLWFDSELGKGTTFYFELPPQGGKREDYSKVVESEAKHMIETL